MDLSNGCSRRAPRICQASISQAPPSQQRQQAVIILITCRCLPVRGGYGGRCDRARDRSGVAHGRNPRLSPSSRRKARRSRRNSYPRQPRAVGGTVGSAICDIVFGSVDPRNRSLVYSSAGHPPAFVLKKNDEVKMLRRSNIILGISHPIRNLSRNPVKRGDVCCISDRRDRRDDGTR